MVMLCYVTAYSRYECMSVGRNDGENGKRVRYIMEEIYMYVCMYVCIRIL